MGFVVRTDERLMTVCCKSGQTDVKILMADQARYCTSERCRRRKERAEIFKGERAS